MLKKTWSLLIKIEKTQKPIYITKATILTQLSWSIIYQIHAPVIKSKPNPI